MRRYRLEMLKVYKSSILMKESIPFTTMEGNMKLRLLKNLYCSFRSALNSIFIDVVQFLFFGDMKRIELILEASL